MPLSLKQPPLCCYLLSPTYVLFFQFQVQILTLQRPQSFPLGLTLQFGSSNDYYGIIVWIWNFNHLGNITRNKTPWNNLLSRVWKREITNMQILSYALDWLNKSCDTIRHSPQTTTAPSRVNNGSERDYNRYSSEIYLQLNSITPHEKSIQLSRI
jgi:hypothetical protein